MDEWRRSLGNWEQGWPGSRPPRHGRPPHPPGPSYQSVPAWERNFCTSVCSIPWKKLCETKGTMSMYKNVVEWNDSAALEAFQNGKARFWAEINGLPCNIPLPDPDMYIDKVKYYAVIDPELVADLEKQPPATKKDDADNGWDSFIFANKSVPATGWGDAEDSVPSNNIAKRRSVNWDDYIEKPIVPIGWGDVEYSVPQNDTSAEPHLSSWDIKHDSNNARSSGSGINNEYSGNAWNCSVGWGHGIVQSNSWDGGRDNSWDNGRNNSWGTWGNSNNERSRKHGRKRDGGGHFGFRSTKSRYQVDNYQMNNNRWTDDRGSNRMNYPYDKTMYAKQPMAMR